MNDRTILAVLLIATLFLFFGCSEDHPEASNTSNMDESASTYQVEDPETEDSEISNTPNANEFTSTYQGLQAKLFDGQGCTHSACHGMAAVGNLDLRADVSYSQLVNVASTGSELKRVEPGLEDHSYLYQKLLAASKPKHAKINGIPMPSSEAPIPDNLLEALRLWIYAGASETDRVPGAVDLLSSELSSPTRIEPSPTGPLVTIFDWAVTELQQDPFKELWSNQVRCGEDEHAPEMLGNIWVYSVQTGTCNWLTIQQPSLSAVRVGDRIRMKVWHFALSAPEPASAWVGIATADGILAQMMEPIPHPARLIELEFKVQMPIAENTPIYFHISNHGTNSWHLLDIQINPEE